MRRVLFITYEFPPSLEIGAHASSQLTRYLPFYDWEPVVLTVRESYYPHRDGGLQRPFPGRIVRTCAIPHPLEIYARLKSGLRVNAHRLDAAGEGDVECRSGGIASLRRWILSLLKIPDVYTGWIVPAVMAGLREIRRQRVNHLCSSAPYWSNHIIGLLLRQLTGLSWTAHFRDPWIGIPQWKPVSTVSKRIETLLERMIVSRATSVVCVTDLHAALFRQLYPELPPEKFVTIPNGFDEAEWGEAGVGRGIGGAAGCGRFVIRYAGSLYQRRNPLALFRAVRALLDSREVDGDRIMIDLVGWCDVAEGRRVKELAGECGIADCVTLTGPLSRAETLRAMAEADVLLLLAEAQPYQIPGKTYEYLRAGRPILALTSNGAVAQLLRRTGGAWVVDPVDEKGIAAAVREAYGHWREGQGGPRAERTVVTTFDRRLLAGRLAELFEHAYRRSIWGQTLNPQ